MFRKTNLGSGAADSTIATMALIPYPISTVVLQLYTTPKLQSDVGQIGTRPQAHISEYYNKKPEMANLFYPTSP
jgi:hypothetical protein